jgi:hypothetical protein
MILIILLRFAFEGATYFMTIRIISVFSLLSINVLLVSRLILRLFAARPDNLFVDGLYRITEPLISPIRILDQHQPLFGAVFEISTLVTIVVTFCLLAAILVWHRRTTSVSE